MRQILFKNLTSLNSRKKDIFLKEVFERNGLIAKTERRCFYFIKDITRLAGTEDLQKWLDSQSDKELCRNKRHFFIYKEHSDGKGVDKLICKIAGNFYAVVGSSVYHIAFLHYFKVRFMKMTMTN